MKLLFGLFVVAIGAVLALNLSAPVKERWEDSNRHQRYLDELDQQRQDFDLQQYQTRQTATLPGKIIQDYGLIVLLLAGLGGLLYTARDAYKVRREPLADFGGYPVARRLVTNGDPRLMEMMLEALRLEGTASIERARASVNVPASYAPHISVATPKSEKPEPTPPAQLSATDTPALPGITDLVAVLENGFTPAKDRILLALGPGGEPLTASVSKMVHIALCGATGGGKSNLLRLLMPQFLTIGARCVLVDPHYADIDPENGDDWRPIRTRLLMEPAVKAREIEHILRLMVEELEKRLERRNKGEKVGRPTFICYDELPVIAELVEDAPHYLGRLLREGRKVGLLTCGASQEFLVKTIGGSSGARDQYRTAYYVGGDKLSAAALLDVPARSIDDAPLGHGLALLRSTATPAAQLVRVPLASNAGVYRLLEGGFHQAAAGYHQATENEDLATTLASDEDEAEAKRKPNGSQTEASDNQATTASVSPEAALAASYFLEGLDPAEITSKLRGISSRQGRRYQTALQETLTLIREGLRGAQL